MEDLNEPIYYFIPGQGSAIPDDAYPVDEIRAQLKELATNIMPVSANQCNSKAALHLLMLTTNPIPLPHIKIIFYIL